MFGSFSCFEDIPFMRKLSSVLTGNNNSDLGQVHDLNAQWSALEFVLNISRLDSIHSFTCYELNEPNNGVISRFSHIFPEICEPQNI